MSRLALNIMEKMARKKAFKRQHTKPEEKEKNKEKTEETHVKHDVKVFYCYFHKNRRPCVVN